MFSYFDLEQKIDFYARAGANVGIVGKAESGLPIYFVKLGDGDQKIIVTASIHARESITASLCLKQIEYALAVKPTAQIYFIPCLNPDGAILFSHGDGYFGKNRALNVQKINGGSKNYSLWKANVNGVDLNTNFPARWGTGKENRFSPSSESFVGFSPLDQSESRAIAEFTDKIKPDGTLSYHAKGQIAYWFFHQEKYLRRDRKIAQAVAEKLGYVLGESFTTSAGGYKDYCVQKYEIPSLTLEIIPDSFTHPLPDYALDGSEIDKHLDLPQFFAEMIKKYSNL